MPCTMDTVRFGADVPHELVRELRASGDLPAPVWAAMRAAGEITRGLPVDWIRGSRQPLKAWPGNRAKGLWFVGFEGSTSRLAGRESNVDLDELGEAVELLTELWEAALDQYWWLPAGGQPTVKRADLVIDFLDVPAGVVLTDLEAARARLRGHLYVHREDGHVTDMLVGTKASPWSAKLYDKEAERANRRVRAGHRILRYELELRPSSLRTEKLLSLPDFLADGRAERVAVKYFRRANFDIPFRTLSAALDAGAPTRAPLSAVQISALGLARARELGAPTSIDPKTRRRWERVLLSEGLAQLDGSAAVGKTARLDPASAQVL
jgi:hypothetical protein